MKPKLFLIIATFFLLLFSKPILAYGACSGFCSTNPCQYGSGTGSCNLGLNCCNPIPPGTYTYTYGCSWNGSNCVPNMSTASCPAGSIDPIFCNAMPQVGCGLIKFTCSSCATCGNGISSGGPSIVNCSKGKGIETAIGCIPTLDPDGQGLAEFFLVWGVGIGGGIAVIMIVISSYMISTAMGDPKKVQAAKELLGSALSGLVLIVFSAYILNFIGVDLLGIF